MKLARVREGGGAMMALVESGTVLRATVNGQSFADLPELLAAAGGDAANIKAGHALGALDEGKLLAPVARPRKIICIGLNYRKHAAEVGLDLPAAPPLFPKWDNCIVGPYEDAPIPNNTDTLDFESELAVVLGRTAKKVAAANAGSVIFGYTCANDVSERRLQNQTGQWGAGKAFDGSCPLGPWIVTLDEIGPDPDLAIKGRLNGEEMQNSRTNDLIYGVPALIEFVTSIITLEAGDLILTGTPEGVGTARRPRRFIQPGETYEVDIEKIGTIRNRFVPESS